MKAICVKDFIQDENCILKKGDMITISEHTADMYGFTYLIPIFDIFFYDRILGKNMIFYHFNHDHNPN